VNLCIKFEIRSFTPFGDMLTKTALLKVLGDILLALDLGNLTLLTLLSLSAAFDSMDHDTLLRRLRTSYGLDGAVMDWFKS